MKKFFVVLMSLLMLSGLFAEEQVVAVYHFENETKEPNKLPANILIDIEEKLRNELIKTKKFKVVNRESMDAVIEQLKEESYNSERDETYRIALGKKLSARYIVVGKVRNNGKKYTVFAEMIDIEKGYAPLGGNADFSNDKESYDRACINVVKQILEPRDSHTCESAKQENSLEAWEDYLGKFPRGICVSEAKSRIKVLKQEEEKRLKEEEELRQSCDADPVNFPCVDITTKYMWSKLDLKIKTYKEAVIYCRSKNEGGFSKWHLPTLNEMRTIATNDGQSKFSDVDSFWTSTTCGGDNAYIFNFSEGKEEKAEKDAGHYVRCVRR